MTADATVFVIDDDRVVSKALSLLIESVAIQSSWFWWPRVQRNLASE